MSNLMMTSQIMEGDVILMRPVSLPPDDLAVVPSRKIIVVL